MKTALILSIAGISLAVGGLTAALYQRENAARNLEKGLRQRLSALEAATAKPKPITPRAPTTFHESPGGSPSPPAATPAPLPSTDSDDAPEEKGFTSEELGVRYANDFDAEPVDSAWARVAEQTMGREIEANLPKGSAILGFSCRSRFCRLDVIHENVEASNELIMDLFFMERNGPLSRTGQGFRSGEPTTTSDGRQHYTFFIGRQGVEMALPPPS